MQKAYNRTIWENYPSDASPIDERNLNNMEVGIDEVDNRVILLDNTKLDKTEAGTFVQDIFLDKTSGIINITYYNGATKQIDTLLEKIAVNFDYDPATQKLTITLDDGEIKEIDLSSLITEYEFDNTGTIAVSVNGGRVSAIVKKGSITEAHLRPDYLADIRVESEKAAAGERAAARYAADSENSAELSKSWAVGTAGEIREGDAEDNSKYYSEQSKASSEEAQGYVVQVKQKGNQILEDIEQAGNDAAEKIENAFEVNAPEFQVDLSTGHLLFEADGYRYLFNVNKENGHLEWRLTV